MNTMDDARSQYDAKWTEYQNVMHAGAWSIGWGFFFVTVGLLPLMWLFIWMVGPHAWEHTLFHAPVLMWLAVPLNLALVVALIVRLYRRNLELDAIKQRYLRELKMLKAQLPAVPSTETSKYSRIDPDAFRDDE